MPGDPFALLLCLGLQGGLIWWNYTLTLEMEREEAAELTFSNEAEYP